MASQYNGQELLALDGLSEEIAAVLVLLRDAIEDNRDLNTIARGMDLLAKLVRAQYAMSARSTDNCPPLSRRRWRGWETGLH